MKKLLLPIVLLTSLNVYSQVGIQTSTPQKTLHVNGSLQVVNEVNVGGTATTAGSPGISGQILTSQGPGTAPAWQTLNTVSGSVNGAMYVQGLSEATATAGQTIDVPGVTLNVTVPPGRTQTLLFTILGYALDITTGSTSQGVFTLLQNGTKISSAYVSKAGFFPNSTQANSSVTVNIHALDTNYSFPVPYSGTAGLVNMPVPVTFLKSVVLNEGTYTFKVQYSSWAGTARVNVNPTTFSGYNLDKECMLTKMQVLIYNN
ncbi:hypothetical protein [Chryseobacterium viscerum]|uniref:hypothetical protein n=1 Tax=Chryseobacterium TaxID=59732 RepID=UPI00222187F9|nr:hypothetical protein [Chryseobacterium viscerum]MCW1961700.1 hypothetical protein [Chryseobacterium viscerum]WPO92849.1 hypothetical protein SFA27_09125 [Chryseobacterium sp. HR92]